MGGKEAVHGKTRKVLFSDRLVTKVTEYDIEKGSRFRKVKPLGQKRPRAVKLKERQAVNLAAEKEAFRYAQEEHICATLHDCDDHCEKRQSISPQSRNAQGREGPHVHVQCEHGYVLISGLKDATLQPECSRSQTV